MLNPASDKPIDVTFPPDTPIKKIYQALCTASGINVIFDPQLKDDKFTIDLRNLTFQKALETTMRQAGHFYKVIDEKRRSSSRRTRSRTGRNTRTRS